MIDFQPQAIYSDAGRLWFEGSTLVEEGRDLPYIEHWHRDAAATVPAAAARLTCLEDGRHGFIVRSGPRFMYARDRGCPLPDAPDLATAVEGAGDIAAARALVDCELSYGEIGGDGWTITRSSLPFREGAGLNPAAAGGRGDLATPDTAPDGSAALRTWTVDTLQGGFDDLLAFTPPGATALSR